MALRAVVKIAKPWAWRGWRHQCHHLCNGEYGIVGPLGSSNNRYSVFPGNFPGLSSIPLINYSSRRRYYLPPAPSESVYVEPIFGIEGSDGLVPYDIKKALPSAYFAVRMHNETQDRNLRFVKVIRASGYEAAGTVYYLTLEAIDENGDLNVYYAEVHSFLKMKKLLHWQLVDESFTYAYHHTRYVCSSESLEQD